MDAQYTLNRMRCAPSRIHDFARAQVGRSCTHRSLSVRTITTACPFVAFSDVDAHEAMQKAPLRRAKNPQLLNLLVYKSINYYSVLSLAVKKMPTLSRVRPSSPRGSVSNAISSICGLHSTQRALHLSISEVIQGWIESCHTGLGTQDPSSAYKRLCPP